jgi:AcrR family transcriptional regulator
MEQRDRIQEKANEMFMRYGIRSVSMDDIAGHLGMSKKTLYQYFSDKDELVEAVMQDEVQRGQKDCQQCNEQSENAIQEIFFVMNGIVEQFRHINPMVIYDLQ